MADECYILIVNHVKCNYTVLRVSSQAIRQRGFWCIYTCRLSWQTAQGGSRGAGEWAEKDQGTLHPLYPRGSTVISSGRGTFFAPERAFSELLGEVCPAVMVTTHPTASTASPPPWQSP